MQEKKRLNQREQDAMMDIAAIVSLTNGKYMDDIAWMLDKIPGGKRDMGMLRAKALKLYERLCEVTPPDTLRAILPTLKHVRCRIGVPLIGHEDTQNQEMGWVVSFDDLSTLTSGCRDKCMLCDKNGAEIGKCELRKVFRRLPSPDEPEPMGGGCGYKRILMSGEADI